MPRRHRGGDKEKAAGVIRRLFRCMGEGNAAELEFRRRRDGDGFVLDQSSQSGQVGHSGHEVEAVASASVPFNRPVPTTLTVSL